MVVFLCNSSNPLERPFCFFLTLSYPLSSFYLSWVCCFPLRPVPSHPPFQTQVSCIWGLLVSLLLVSWLLFSLFLFFWLIFLFLFVSVVLLWDYDNKRRFPCNSGFFFKRGASIADTDKGFPAIREMFCLFSPPLPQGPYSKPLSVCHFILFFSSVFHFNIVFFINPFWDIILVSFLWLDHLCCPFPFFVSASFLPTSFLPSPSPIHLAFILGRFALLFFLFARYCFQAWRFLLSFSCWFLFGFLLTVVVTSFSSLGVVFFVSLSVVFGCANVAKVVLVSAQGSFFKTTLGLSFSLIFASFSVFHFNIPRFFSWTQLLS